MMLMRAAASATTATAVATTSGFGRKLRVLMAKNSKNMTQNDSKIEVVIVEVAAEVMVVIRVLK